MKETVKLFKAIGDETRIKVLLLCLKETYVQRESQNI